RQSAATRRVVRGEAGHGRRQPDPRLERPSRARAAAGPSRRGEPARGASHRDRRRGPAAARRGDGRRAGSQRPDAPEVAVRGGDPRDRDRRRHAVGRPRPLAEYSGRRSTGYVLEVTSRERSRPTVTGMQPTPRATVVLTALGIGAVQIVGSIGAANNQPHRKDLDVLAVVLLLIGPAALA